MNFIDPAAKTELSKGRKHRGPIWAEVVGYGPKKQTCKTCVYLRIRSFSGTYFKCGMQPITGGPGTDIRLKDPACMNWKLA